VEGSTPSGPTDDDDSKDKASSKERSMDPIEGVITNMVYEQVVISITSGRPGVARGEFNRNWGWGDGGPATESDDFSRAGVAVGDSIRVSWSGGSRHVTKL
jgi:hypothetical protein